MYTSIEILQFPQLELLNSEGPILKAINTPTGYIMLDQYHKIIGTLTQSEIESFIAGTRVLSDSYNKTIRYTSCPEGMKPSLSTLNAFLGL